MYAKLRCPFCGSEKVYVSREEHTMSIRYPDGTEVIEGRYFQGETTYQCADACCGHWTRDEDAWRADRDGEMEVQDAEQREAAKAEEDEYLELLKSSEEMDERLDAISWALGWTPKRLHGEESDEMIDEDEGMTRFDDTIRR